MSNKPSANAAIFVLVILASLLCACTGGSGKLDRTAVMVKNEQTKSYGSGFAAGCPGKYTKYIVTAYSVIGTVNGVRPEKAKVKISDAVNDMLAEVIYCDEDRDIAILELPEESKALKPLPMSDFTEENVTVTAYGFGGTGNLMSDFESFNRLDTVQYNGLLAKDKKSNGMEVYTFSGDFNKAAGGGPVLDNNSIVGMCAFSSGNEAFSHYIIPSGYICQALDKAKIEYLTSKEVLNKKIMSSSIMLGGIILLASAVWGIVNNKKRGSRIFLQVCGGSLEGNVYEMPEKCFIGRDPGCLISYPVDEPGVGRFHCTLRKGKRCCFLTDNNSGYGVFFENGQRLTPNKEYEIDSESIFYLADKRNTIKIMFERSSS